MSDPIDNAIDETENDSKKTKRSGARSRYYFCAASRGGKKVIHEMIEALDADEAKELFSEKYEIEPSVCDDGKSIGGGIGFYLAMGTGKSAAQRISVTVSVKQLALRTPKAITAEFKGWKVYGSGLRACEVDGVDYEDDDLVSIEFDERVDSESNVQKPKLKKKEVIRFTDLENVQTL